MTDIIKELNWTLEQIRKYEKRYGHPIRYLYVNPKIYADVLSHAVSTGRQVIPVPELPFREIVYSHYSLQEWEREVSTL